MQRKLRVTIGTATGLIAGVVLALALLSAYDWNQAKPWINERVSQATGRPFAINGDLSMKWQAPATPLAGWRRWVPWPHLRATDVTMGNPDWATTGPHMARIQQVDFSVDLLPLLRKTIRVSSLVLTEPEIALELSEDGEKNWTFDKEDDKKQSDWHFLLNDITLTRGTVHFVDPVKRADLTARIDSVTQGNKDSIEWKVSGNFNGENVSGGGNAGALLSLQQSGVKYPVQAEVHVGKTEITLDGTLTDPVHFSELDVNLKILGASMAQLFPLTGLVLPETPHFSTEGRVVGKVAREDMHLRYEKFKGRVGSSDIAGTIEYLQRDPRPLLRGEVVSKYLNLKDLGALLAADSPEEQRKRGVKSKQPANKVVPVEPFKTERWDKMDIQVQVTGGKIVRSEALPIENLFAKVKLDDGVLSLAPLNFGVAGGKLVTDVRIDSHSDPAKAHMKISARGVQLKRLFPTVETEHASIGEISGDAELTSTGNSPAALLGSANGEVKALITEGGISKLVLEAMGLNVGSVVVSKLFGDHLVKLNCMVTDIAVNDGLMETRAFVLDTEDATVLVDGKVNLETEKIDLGIYPQSKGLRIISLHSPLYIGGTFKHPDVGVDKGAIALRAGAAATLATVAAPLAAVIALVNAGRNEDSPCGALLAEGRKKPEAPAPGQSGKTR